MINKFLGSFFIASCLLFACEAVLPQIDGNDAKTKINEIMKGHASYKKLTPQIAKRALENYLEELDPTKTYLISSDINKWSKPTDGMLEKVLSDFDKGEFTEFDQIFETMVKAIERRNDLEKHVNLNTLPKNVSASEFKDMNWVNTEQELLTRLMRLRSLQIETATKLNEEMKEKTMQRIAKRQAKFEEEILTTNPTNKKRFVLSNTIKAFASALDTHTAYFTPDEAKQFLINVQQRLFGIGAQLRDDLNGFTVVKIVEGGPAYRGKELKAKDRIVAVDGEPVVGMDIVDAVEMIRGEENTVVKLTVVREVEEGNTTKKETLDVPIVRGEVIIEEYRFESNYEPFGDGVIAYLKLHSFYQDNEHSSAADLTKALEKIMAEHNIKGVVLDLRYNSGGMLPQAVAVAGLFISKGVVVSIKDDKGEVQHLRDLEGKTIWKGPLIVLVNRGSASASEIVAQTLQDYGRALIVGDDHTYGKGSFQTFTLNSSGKGGVNPKGEYKVTRGRYYTVSGRSPQLVGVQADIVVPGLLSESEIGEKYAKYPLETDKIKANFDDDLSDIPFYQRAKVELFYKHDLQPRLHVYEPFVENLGKNSAKRIGDNINYQNFLKELKKKDKEIEESEENEFGRNDLQLTETYNIMKDLILLLLMHKQESTHSATGVGQF